MACERKEGSQFWRSIQSIKHEIRLGATSNVGDGRSTLFWLDSWCGRRPLRDEVPELFNICVDQSLLVPLPSRAVGGI